MSAQRAITPPAALSELFASALPGLPGAADPDLRHARQASFERFHRLGFPGPKSEAWKYTSLAPLARTTYRLPQSLPLERRLIVPWLLDAQSALRLVFVNGSFRADLSDDLDARVSGLRVRTLATSLEDGGAGTHGHNDPERLDDRDRSFSALNEAFAADGGVIEVVGRAPLSVQLLFVSGGEAPALISPRNRVVLAPGAEVELVETHVALDGSDNLTNLVSTFEIGAGACLRHDRLQVGSVAGTLITRNRYRLASDARLEQSLATLGGSLVRNEIDALLEGSGIECHFNGLYLTRERQHVDNMLRIDHAQPNSESNQFYKGVLDGRAQAAFAGKIMVRRPAQKTNAYQSNNNLLLSPEAEINTKPELEIYADDVKCSHGATAGEIDEHELFYLRSRGLDCDTARSLLTFAFADEVLERFGNAEVALQAKREVVRWLPGGRELEGVL